MRKDRTFLIDDGYCLLSLTRWGTGGSEQASTATPGASNPYNAWQFPSLPPGTLTDTRKTSAPLHHHIRYKHDN
jgi:hypothetical protein